MSNLKNLITSTLVIFSFLSFSINEMQSQTADLLFVIKSNGDSLATSKIFTQRTNEEKVVFLSEGLKKELSAAEVSSYYEKGRYVNIKVSPDDRSKLVRIVLRGTIYLAKSTSPKRDELYYIRHEDKWFALDHSLTNLKGQLSDLIEDFAATIDDRKIQYNLVSLGRVIAKYNEEKDSSHKSSGDFDFNDISKLGIYGMSGLSTIRINDVASTHGTTLTNGIGLGGSIQFDKIVSLLIQMGYTRSNWQNDNYDFEFKTLNFTPMISAQLYNKSNYFRLSAATGIHINLDLASSAYSPSFYSRFINQEFNKDARIGLRKFSIGYQFMLNASFGNSFDLFTAYQVVLRRATQSFGAFNFNKTLVFDTNDFKVGIVYYFIK